MPPEMKSCPSTISTAIEYQRRAVDGLLKSSANAQCAMPNAQCPLPTKDQGPRTKDQGPRTKNQGLFRVEGMPDWFITERFDVRAKAPAGLSMEPFAEVRGQLLRSLLEDRFKLKARLVTKETAAMVITLARADERPAQEQLGLRIRTGRAPVEVLVIESVDRPTDN